ncbi:MAG: hypothetical protein DI536_25735 [Archangium gephyra]|uniref:START domain-containing protein n=1 Tax=Archangium gephyra TaxID=48 RepID=A0A2W5VD38_9BACT|nr:MAG: hypothetical protein DI536_25735 [Archangium gephyra]
MRRAFVLTLFATSALAAEPTMRRETRLEFAIDDAFQNDGGVQFFYEFFEPAQVADAGVGTDFARVRTLDDKATHGEQLHAVMSRIVYTLERDITYFTEARARDVKYINTIAPEVKATVDAKGVFHTSKPPANSFTIEWQKPLREDSPYRAFLPAGAEIDSLIVQRNSDFDRMFGFKTAERAVTWTAHQPLGEGRTRVFVVTMSLMHNIPPGFMGGKERVYKEAVESATQLIGRLRNYKGP